ncbi:MAG TPA: pyridoxal phosphate-dependent aminotransferase family protein [Acidimicrobiia bacterium]|nr:pyridoxal phosphate-dependent aminotransferase family protein [Acidimicrobiia bacterium]
MVRAEATDGLPAAQTPGGADSRSLVDDTKPQRRRDDTWLDSWSAAVSDLARLTSSHPMMDAVIDEQRGRQIRVGDQWLADFASCNYLGFDLDEEIIAAVPEYLSRWGTHPSWSRLLGSPRLYPEIEEQMTDLLACEDVLLLPTITLIHSSVIPVLVGNGTVFLDGRAHKTIYDGAMYATSHGATVQRFQHDDWEHVDVLLRASDPSLPRLIVLDGVNSMTGNAPDVAEFARVARERNALLYIDDAHGFGVIGERSPDELCDYGIKGNSILRHLDVDYENVVLVAGFSKAYSSLLAFLALPTRLKEALKVMAPPYLYSGPSPVASLATVLAGLEVNRKRGDQLRYDLWRRTHRVLEALDELSIRTPNRSGYPLIEIPLADHRDIDAVGRFLFDHGIYVTLAAYPLVPKHEVGFRVQVTAANTDEEIEHLVATIRLLADRFQLAGPSNSKS